MSLNKFFSLSPSSIPKCLGIEIMYKGKDDISLHFYCLKGDEEILFASLPIWFIHLGEVIIGSEQVFIKLKN